MKLIIFGMQGSGKGTQAKKIAEKYNIKHISTGDIFRENVKNQTELGKKVVEYMNKGELVPDSLTCEIVKDTLNKVDGFILDGFPRNLFQAEELAKMLDIDKVINLKLTDEEAVKRISGRRSCQACGAVFHTLFNPPKQENVCDICKETLIQRDDDKEEAIRKRLELYHENERKLLDFYQARGILVNVDGVRPIDVIFDDICNVLNEI